MKPEALSADTLPGWLHGQPGEFTTTQWSVVLAAADRDGNEGARAMERLCLAYWRPLFAFVRRRGLSAEEARDSVQGFFASLLEGSGVSRADRDKGRFRSWLLGAMQHWLSDARRAARAQRRGGLLEHVPLEDLLAESAGPSAPDCESPENTFDRRWAEELLQRVLLRLERECEAQDRAGRFAVLKEHLVSHSREVPVSETAARLGISENAANSAIHRLRQRYRAIFHEEIAATVQDPAEVDGEIQHLLRVLGGG